MISVVVLVSQNIDCNGHGTHISGTIAVTTYGVAKANIVGVKRFPKMPSRESPVCIGRILCLNWDLGILC
ncbi:hypothetical protein BC936DRAFT_146905 [Jimgerdemannia flammicorona]|uniref:Peptidase S8/S53 domain-containing protein n=1 Tax=Jimgerdemannia flammicorona TaxID=994334 RepID=A0A433D6I6_9FUNG|nr:hypothetical protein BC936DRAFT_146905 [Jimgerdemannia flammicorona]